MPQILKIDKLEFDQFIEAVRFSDEQLGYLGYDMIINPPQRFKVFKKLGVELVLAMEQNEILGICFVLPDQTPIKHHPFVWLFGMVTKPEGKNIGALMLFKMMHLFPAIMCIGVTEIAGKLYRALRWKEYHEVWRCVHPIDLAKMFDKYKDRIKNNNHIKILESLGPFYNLGVNFGQLLVSIATLLRKSRNSINSPIPSSEYNHEIALVSSYRKLYNVTMGRRVLEAIEMDGIARVVRDEFSGWEKLLAHMQVWKKLKCHGGVGMEYIATSLAEKRQALLYGYAPIRMPIHYWDKYGKLSDFFEVFPGSNFTFASCDKIL